MIQGILRTARPLSPEQRSRINRRFESLLGESVAFEERVEPRLIGGICVEVGGKSYDGSLRTQLDAMLRAMTRGEEVLHV